MSPPEACLALAVCILESACSGLTAVGGRAGRYPPLGTEDFGPYLPAWSVKQINAIDNKEKKLYKITTATKITMMIIINIIVIKVIVIILLIKSNNSNNNDNHNINKNDSR